MGNGFLKIDFLGFFYINGQITARSGHLRCVISGQPTNIFEDLDPRPCPLNHSSTVSYLPNKDILTLTVIDKSYLPNKDILTLTDIDKYQFNRQISTNIEGNQQLINIYRHLLTS